MVDQHADHEAAVRAPEKGKSLPVDRFEFVMAHCSESIGQLVMYIRMKRAVQNPAEIACAPAVWFITLPNPRAWGVCWTCTLNDKVAGVRSYSLVSDRLCNAQEKLLTRRVLEARPSFFKDFEKFEFG